MVPHYDALNLFACHILSLALFEDIIIYNKFLLKVILLYSNGIVRLIKSNLYNPIYF